MKVLLIYKSNSISNSIVSSTLSKKGCTDIEMVAINIDKRNIYKYLKKCEEDGILPDVIYIYDGDYIKLFISQDIRVVEYTKKVVYKPARVPGNNLKTRVYLLHEKIHLDIVNNFEKTKIYVPYVTNNLDDIRVKMVEIDSFEKKYIKYSKYRDGFEKRTEALEYIKRKLDILKENKISQIQKLELKLEKIVSKIDEIDEDIEN